MENDLPRKESPLDLNYIKIWKVFALSLGGWPKEKGVDEHKLAFAYRKFLPAFSVFVTFCIFHYFYKHHNDGDFMTRGQLYLSVVSVVVTTIRVLVPLIENYHQVAQRYFNEFHLIHFKRKNEFSMKVYNVVDKISYYFTIYFFAITQIATVAYNVPSAYHNYKIGVLTDHRVENSTMKFSTKYSVPGLDEEDMFITYTIVNIYLSYVAGGYHCLLDLYLTLVVFQVIGHLYILKYDLASILKPKKGTILEVNDFPILVEMYDKEENKQIYKKVTECIRYHLWIISFTDDVSAMFGPTIAVSYLFHLFGCCICSLQVLSGDLAAIINYGFYAVGIFGQLLYISILFEVLSAKSEKLIDAVYDVPWECMDVPNRRSVLMLLRRVQRPIRVTALGLADVGVGTMTRILKATFSYYTFFSSFK